MKYFNQFALLLMSVFCLTVSAQDKEIKLPAPQKEIGKPLMQVLNSRQSVRSFAPTPLSFQDISNLLWAAFGINREDGKRTAPSSRNIQDIDIYVFIPDGVFLYNAKENKLVPISSEDLRGMTGTQDYVKSAPLNLVYISDQSKMGKASSEDKYITSGADAGFIAQNVYLYCASQNLGAVVRASVDKKPLFSKLNLKQGQVIVLTQTVGYKQ
jgi:SagB-type dehydrogenase family enzyme